MNMFTPMIAKISQNIKQTNSTLKILGKAPTRALTTTFMPSILAIARNGLRALKVLMVLNMGMFPAPNNEAPKFIRDTATITKSSQHQALPKYITVPIANNFNEVSKKNTTVKIRSR